MVIHLIAPEDKNKWNPIWHKCFKSIKRLPYDVLIWTDEKVDDLLKEDDTYFFNEYLDKLHPIYKWDYVRYIILEKYRGAYLDMDIEIINNFFPMLNPEKFYIKEGTLGSYLENSMMISQSPFFDGMWARVRTYCKNLIINNFSRAIEDKTSTIALAGPDALTKFIIKNIKIKEDSENKKLFEILSHEHFGSLTNEVSFSRHYNLSTWS